MTLEKMLTARVHSATQYPVSEKSDWCGGMAILSVYSKPNSITPASYSRSDAVYVNLTPELSIKPRKQ